MFLLFWENTHLTLYYSNKIMDSASILVSRPSKDYVKIDNHNFFLNYPIFPKILNILWHTWKWSNMRLSTAHNGFRLIKKLKQIFLISFHFTEINSLELHYVNHDLVISIRPTCPALSRMLTCPGLPYRYPLIY